MAVKLVEQRVPRGDATRQALMKAAEQLFAEKGPFPQTVARLPSSEPVESHRPEAPFVPPTSLP